MPTPPVVWVRVVYSIQMKASKDFLEAVYLCVCTKVLCKQSNNAGKTTTVFVIIQDTRKKKCILKYRLKVNASRCQCGQVRLNKYYFRIFKCYFFTFLRLLLSAIFYCIYSYNVQFIKEIN